MRRAINQTTPWSRWPSGDCRTVFVLRQPPEALSREYGFSFEHDSDNLDEYDVAAVGDPKAGQFWLWHYRHSPEAGTDVVFDAALPRSKAREALQRQLGTHDQDIAWAVGDRPEPARATQGRTKKPVVVVLHGPSGVGKDAVVDQLRQRTGIHRAMSSTSRPRRPGEEGDGHYHFLTREEFEAKIRAGEFLEYAEVYGDWKGLERSEVLPYLERGEDVIIRTDVQGARTWRTRLPAAVTVFLTAEDRETLRQRLTDRNTENGEGLVRRLAELEEELTDIPNNDYVVVNRHEALDEAVAEIALIIERERSNFLRPRPVLAE